VRRGNVRPSWSVATKPFRAMIERSARAGDALARNRQVADEVLGAGM
jgi:hypothetical protein